MKITLGEVFAIQTKIGFGFLQYVGVDQFGCQIVRILESIKPIDEITRVEVEMPERFTVHFVAKAALTRKIISRAGAFGIPKEYIIPKKGREPYNIRGEFLGWHIVDLQTLKRELKQQLSSDDLKLPPAGHPNDTLLKEWLEKNWRPENWK